MNKSEKEDVSLDIALLKNLLSIKGSEFLEIANKIKILKIKSSETKGQIDLLNDLIKTYGNRKSTKRKHRTD